MSENPLRFEVQAIRDQGGASLALDLDAERLLGPQKEAAPEGPLRLEAEFSVGGNTVLFQARLRGAWKLPCRRCLVEHRREFAASFEETYPFTDEQVDVSGAVREAALLELPPWSLCRPDCRGLCPKCGTNLNQAACSCAPEAPSQFEALRKLTVRKEKKDAEPKT